MVDLRAPTADVTPRARALVLLDPRGAFAAVNARPLWGLALVVMLAFSVAPPVAFLTRVDETAFAERKLRRSGALEKVPKEQHAQIIDVTAKATKFIGPPGAIVKRAGWILLVAAIAFGLLRSKKPEQKFAPIFAAMIVGAAPLAVKDLFEAGAFLVQDP